MGFNSTFKGLSRWWTEVLKKSLCYHVSTINIIRGNLKKNWSVRLYIGIFFLNHAVCFKNSRKEDHYMSYGPDLLHTLEVVVRTKSGIKLTGILWKTRKVFCSVCMCREIAASCPPGTSIISSKNNIHVQPSSKRITLVIIFEIILLIQKVILRPCHSSTG